MEFQCDLNDYCFKDIFMLQNRTQMKTANFEELKPLKNGFQSTCFFFKTVSILFQKVMNGRASRVITTLLDNRGQIV